MNQPGDIQRLPAFTRSTLPDPKLFFDTLIIIVELNGSRGCYISDGLTWNLAIGSFAPLADPVFTGNPQAPTAAAGDSDTSIATTAFVARYKPVITDVSAARTLALADFNEQYQSDWRHPAADTTPRIWTIPANGTIPIPIGARWIGFNEPAAGALTIAITTDTLILAGAGTTGSRTVAAGGEFVARKVAAQTWFIGGPGVT